MGRGERGLRRAGRPGVFGPAHVLLLFAGSAAVAGTSGPGRHSLDASVDDVASYVAGAELARIWIGEYLAVLAYLLFVPFAAYLAAVLHDRPSAWHAAAARGAAWLYVGLSLTAVALLVPPHHRDLEPMVAAAFLDLRTTLLALSFIALAGWLILTGGAAAAFRALPRWLAWTAVGLGLLQLLATPLAVHAQELTGLPTFASLLWIAVVGVLLWRRGRAVTAPAVT